jgi:hypothetical protein
MLSRLIPQLLNWLDQNVTNSGQSASENERMKSMMQEFALQSARQELTSQSPVQTADDAASWLVLSIQLAYTPRKIQLHLSGSTEEQVTLRMNAKHLRQWLIVVYEQWCRAGWPETLWPVWIRNYLANATEQSQGAFH